MAAKNKAPDARSTARVNVPKAVRTFMTDRGMSRLQLMAATGLSKQTLSERLKGDSPFKDEELLALAWLFDCDPGEFFRLHPNLNQGSTRAKPGLRIPAAQAA